MFREMVVQMCPETIYLTATKCLRGQACSPIPRSKPHFRPWGPMRGAQYHLKKEIDEMFHVLLNFLPMASDPRKQPTKQVLCFF
jgi:hypothetical protein